MHDFQNMNKLYEHLKRVHSDQPLQCPRCARMDFGSSGELQAHQIAPEPCSPVPLTAVKRVRWITHGERTALQSAVNQHLRGGADEEKWKFAYRRLFPETDHTPCPYLQNPVISIVSYVVDDFEIHLREMIHSSSDLNDLENQIPNIRGQFLARHGISIDEVEQDSPSLTSLRTVSSSPGSGRLSTITPPDVAGVDQPYLGGGTNHDQLNLSLNAQLSLNVLQPGVNAHQEVSLEPHMLNDLDCLQNDDFADFDDMPSWDPKISKDLHGSGPLRRKESLDFA
ncbi:hypothetical protein KCU73_g1121, partial [Aureobasidium melanogenum]